MSCYREHSICEFRRERGGALFASLGSEPEEADATSVRTKSCGGTEMGGGRIPCDSRTVVTVEEPNSLTRRDGSPFVPSSGTILGTSRANPVVTGTAQRFRCNMISSNTNRGRLTFMISRQRFRARVFLNILSRLLRLTRKTRRKVFLMVDGHAARKSRSVNWWLAEHAEQIRIFCLPSYSPELNPDELLN
jgi:hypothetical protein